MNDIHSRNSHGQIYRSCTVRARTVRWECDCDSFARIVYLAGCIKKLLKLTIVSGNVIQ